MSEPPPLTLLEQEVLAFEIDHPNARTPDKEALIATELGLSTTHYWQIINALLDHPTVIHDDPYELRDLRFTRDHARRRNTPTWE